MTNPQTPSSVDWLDELFANVGIDDDLLITYFRNAIKAHIKEIELEARLAELERLPKVELDKPFAHKSGRYRNHSRFTIQYVDKRLAELKTQKDTIDE